MAKAAKTTKPSTNGSGRNKKGRFVKGNNCSNGNPHAAKIATWRATLAKSITAKDVEVVVKKLRDLAKGGTEWAIKEFLNRTLGKPTETVDMSFEDKSPRYADLGKISAATRAKMLEELEGPE